MSTQIWWYIARSSGIVALALSGASVIWGLLLSSRSFRDNPGPRWLLDLHRWLGGCAVAFTGVHVAGLMLDSYVSFGLTDVLVPFAASWKPAAVAWGVVSAWLLVAVQVTSLMMRHLPRRLWKGIHLSSYAVLWMGIIHGSTAGSDAGNPLYVLGVAAMALVVVFLTILRVLVRGPVTAEPSRRRRPVPS